MSKKTDLDNSEDIRETVLNRLQKINYLQEHLLGSGEMTNKLKAITDNVVTIFEADFSRIWMIRPGDICDSGCIYGSGDSDNTCRNHEKCLHLMASSGRYTHIDGDHRRVPIGSFKIGRLATGPNKSFLTNNAQEDRQIHNREWAKNIGLRSFAGYRLKDNKGDTKGVLALFSKKIIPPEEFALLESLGNSTAQVIQSSLAEESLILSLNEKELLIKEIHHRVKNNLAVIHSLINLQSQNIQDEKYKKIFKDSLTRIRAMGLIHEKLYRSEDLSMINFSDYIEDMINNMYMTYGLDSRKVTLKKDIKRITLGLDSAIPCGLIVNELLSNCMKYAFPDGRAGELHVALHIGDNSSVKLTISDNGTGFPKDIDFRTADTMGMTIVNALVGQLQGTIELNRERGTEFVIEFKDKNSINDLN